MIKLRICISLIVLMSSSTLMGIGCISEDQSFKQLAYDETNHVSAGPQAYDLAEDIETDDPEVGIKRIVRLLHNTDHFVHINREHLRRFSQPGFSLEEFKTNLSEHIEQLRAQAGDDSEKLREVSQLEKDLAAADNVYAAYVAAYSEYERKDWPFCLGGEQYIELEVIDGCTSFAKTFITLANAAQFFDDVRLLVSKSYEGLEQNIDLLGTGEVPPSTIDGHQMVLVKYDGRWHLVNTTYYRSGTVSGIEEFEILDQLNGEPIKPETIMYQEIRLPSMQGQELHRQVVGAVGSNRYDDLSVHRWEDTVCIGTSIPREVFDNL